MGAGGAPEPPPRARGRSGAPLAFCSTLTYPFRSDGGVVCRAHSCANLGRWVSANLQEEPPSLCTEREGRQVLSWLFIRPSRMRVCLLRPPRVRAWVTGSQHIYRKSSLASAWSKRAVRSSPGFLYDPRATFSFGRRGLFAETPSRASLGRWVSARFAGRAPEPPHGARGRSGVPLAFYATLAHPFRSEGGVEYARLPSVGASGDTPGELLSGKSEWRPVPHSIRVG